MDGGSSNNDDKPFVCSVTGCKQRFVTEDKLSLHRRKHEFAIDGLTAALFTDETPTPTTFLRDCETMGLFHDLAVKNPFDESFRKAVVGGESDADLPDVLDTPTIVGMLPDSAAALTGILNTPTGTSSIRDMPCRFLSRLKSTLGTPSADLRSHPMLFPMSDSLDDTNKSQTPPLSPSVIIPTDSPTQSTSSPPNISPTVTTSPTTKSDTIISQPSSTSGSSGELSLDSSLAAALSYTVSKSTDTGVTMVTACVVADTSTTTTTTHSKNATSPPQNVILPALPSPIVFPIPTAQPASKAPNSKLSTLLKSQTVATTSLLMPNKNPVLTSRGGKNTTSTTTTKTVIHSIQPAKTAIVGNNVVNNAAAAPMLQCQLPTGAVAFLVPAVRTGVLTQNIGAAPRDPTATTGNANIISLTNPVLAAANPSQSVNSVTSLAPDVAAVTTTVSDPPAHNIVKQKLKVTLAAKNSSELNNDPALSQSSLTLNEALYNGQLEDRRGTKRSHDSQMDDYSSPGSQYSQGESVTELSLAVVPSNEVDDSRQKILERNRNAARRCRKKKKVFLESLEQRLKEANQLNAQLMSENTALKLEITQLKSLLIQHKGCDITRDITRNVSLSKPTAATTAVVDLVPVEETTDIELLPVSPNPDII